MKYTTPADIHEHCDFVDESEPEVFEDVNGRLHWSHNGRLMNKNEVRLYEMRVQADKWDDEPERD